MAIDTEAGVFDDVREGAGCPLGDQRYILKIVRLEATEGEFGPSIKWVFNCADASLNPPALVRDATGEAYEFFQFSAKKMNVGTKPHKWACAFLGREVGAGESGASLARELLGKKASCLIGPNQKSGKQCILSARSIEAAAAPAPTPPPAPATFDTGGDGF